MRNRHEAILRLHGGHPFRTIDTGVTNDLERRNKEHRHKINTGFTARYGVSRLGFIEELANIDDAIAREKQIKGLRRERKIPLIEAENPTWRDLSHGWFE